jgi:transposase-like protein
MKKYSEAEKAMWLDDWQESGKSAWKYAKENGLNPQTLANWTKPKTESKSCFVEVTAPVVPSVQYNQKILIEKGEVKIHIPLAPCLSELRSFMERLVGIV